MLSSLPSSPGVYWFLDDDGNVLYVGKAKNLKKRVTSYSQLKRLNSRIHQLSTTATRLKHQVLESELEALLVEAELIRTHQPEFNVLLKDDKTPLYIVITKELFPRVLTARKKELDHRTITGTVLGPFQSGYKAREVLQIARTIFPWCSQPPKTALQIQSGRPCFYYHLDLCSGACVGEVTSAQYQEMIHHLMLFLRGQKKDILRELKEEMKSASEHQEYEKAGLLRDQIKLIDDVTSTKYKLKPDMVLPQLQATQSQESLVRLHRLLRAYMSLPPKHSLHRIEGYDVSNTQGTNAAVSMVTFIDGQSDPSEYKLFNIRGLDTPNDFAMMQEALQRRQNHPEWEKPDLIVIDGGKGQLRKAIETWTWSNPVISIAKDPDRIIIPTMIYRPPSGKRLHITYEIISLPETEPALKLIQQIRNESHRFSKKQHSRRRLKENLGLV